ncbi:MAG: hypothetical protein GW903_09685 [Alphaproteobacteria bacterium]|nr:hypothetical protein [Alphaproteobacteria bacterium]NCQ89277.1 hypothetical protein [Alphaproteobacteria bacterium]NCT08140.1 hypothetical protein [Alphaproteobacteria bacterium]
MNIYTIDQWTVKWSKPANASINKAVALFSCPSIKSNIIYTYEDILVSLNDASYSSVPKNVFDIAIAMLYQQEYEPLAA